jgi:hypothetical protein
MLADAVAEPQPEGNRGKTGKEIEYVDGADVGTPITSRAKNTVIVMRKVSAMKPNNRTDRDAPERAVAPQLPRGPTIVHLALLGRGHGIAHEQE